MLFYKALGCLLVLLSGAGAGRILCTLEQRRYRQAEGFLALVRHVRAQIDCFALPVADILAGCDESLRCDCGFSRSACDFSALLADCELYVSEDFCEALTVFASRLGVGYRAEQLQCCDDCIERLGRCCKQLRATRAARRKALVILPLFAAACLALLLW